MATYTTVLAIVNTKDGVWDTVPVEIDAAFLDVWFADEAETGPVTPRFRLMRPEELGVSPDILTRHITLRRRLSPCSFNENGVGGSVSHCTIRLDAVPVSWRDAETGLWPAPEMDWLRKILDMKCDLYSSGRRGGSGSENGIESIISLIQMIRRRGAAAICVSMVIGWDELPIGLSSGAGEFINVSGADGFDDVEAEKRAAARASAELTLIGERLSLAARGRLERRRWAAVAAWERVWVKVK
jgi:hypothetical protein